VDGETLISEAGSWRIVRQVWPIAAGSP
jgi:hypothetical protein